MEALICRILEMKITLLACDTPKSVKRITLSISKEYVTKVLQRFKMEKGGRRDNWGSIASICQTK